MSKYIFLTFNFKVNFKIIKKNNFKFLFNTNSIVNYDL